MTPVRVLGGLLAANRVLFGVAFLVAPERTAAGWVGRVAGREGAKVFIRGLGARDLALGAGALQALARPGADHRPWFAAQAVSDGADLAATYAARRRLPAAGVRFAVPVAAVSTLIGLAGALSAPPEAD